MRWLGNIYDPNREEFPEKAPRMSGESQYDAWRRWVNELNGKFIGPPRESKEYSVEELEAMHIVGVYEK